MMLTTLKISRDILFLALLAFVLLAGCKPTQTYFQGYQSENMGNVALSNIAAHPQQWQTFDVKLAYQAHIENQTLNIAGSGQLGNYYQLNSSRIPKLDIYLFFINSEAKVIKTERLYRALLMQPEAQISFNKTLQVPSGAKAISFGYDGKAIGDGGGEINSETGGGGADFFWKLPTKNS